MGVNALPIAEGTVGALEVHDRYRSIGRSDGYPHTTPAEFFPEFSVSKGFANTYTDVELG